MPQMRNAVRRGAAGTGKHSARRPRASPPNPATPRENGAFSADSGAEGGCDGKTRQAVAAGPTQGLQDLMGSG